MTRFNLLSTLSVSLFLLLLHPAAWSQCEQNYDWAVWNSFSGNTASGTITNPNGTIGVTMTANYTFDSTPNIFNYGAFSGFNGNLPPNATVPRTTWAAGQGGETTMCFSETVSNPVLLISSLGSPGIVVTLEFSLPYSVLFDGGGMSYPNDMSIIGQEGYAILLFPGDFDCVTIYSSTPEFYTNITWGINPPLFEVELTGDTIACLNTTITASGGVSYQWSGGQQPNSPANTFDASGNYFVTVTDANGCTVVTSVNVEIHPEYQSTLSEEICEGEVYFFQGSPLDQPGVYEALLFTEFGCDSLITLDLQVHPVDLYDWVESICAGGFFEFNGLYLTDPGIYSATYTNQFGCDSTVNLQLFVVPASTTEWTAIICEGESYPFNGVSLSQPGQYLAELVNQYGCDSTIVLQLDVLPATQTDLEAAICSGQTYLFDGLALSQPGTYSANKVNQYGCDSLVTLTLNVLPASLTEWPASICEGEVFLFHGTALDSAGTYQHTLTGSNGCDSLLVVHLTVSPAPVQTLQAQICTGQSYLFNGAELTQAGAYSATLQTASGCDSIIQLQLEVVATLETNIQVQLCQGETYPFGGMQLDVAGLYTDTLTSAGGCDSISRLELSILPNSSSELNAGICQGESYLFQGDTLTLHGTYSALITAANGCDSLLTLQLQVNPTPTVAVQGQICQGQAYPFQGQWLTEAGQYEALLQTTQGCDSTVLLTLTIASTLETSLNTTLCPGESYLFGGSLISEAGIYADTLVSLGGCDSIITLTVNTFPVYQLTRQEGLCAGESLYFGGEWLNSTGTYTETLQSAAGCDSTTILQLTVHPAYILPQEARACDRYTWPVTNLTYTSSGQYTVLLQTSEGCDSLLTLELTISPRFRQDEVVQSNRAYTWPVNNQTYGQSGYYLFEGLSSDGCDSIHTLTLTIIRDENIYIPNSFSPNLDGINDRFTLFGDENLLLIQELTIYDRWGNKLAQYTDLPPSDAQYGWDGYSRGQPLDPGVFVFTARLLLSDDRTRNVHGEVILIR